MGLRETSRATGVSTATVQRALKLQAVDRLSLVRDLITSDERVDWNIASERALFSVGSKAGVTEESNPMITLQAGTSHGGSSRDEAFHLRQVRYSGLWGFSGNLN